jgi:hypothetical protein
MRGKILVGLLALIPKPVVVANGYLIGNTPSRFWQFSGGNIFFLRDSNHQCMHDGLTISLKLNFTEKRSIIKTMVEKTLRLTQTEWPSRRRWSWCLPFNLII